LLAHHGARADAAGEVGYLEADRALNVRFYERFDVAVIGEQDVPGAPSWFMRRVPGAGR
jgi:hypothetical protein